MQLQVNYLFFRTVIKDFFRVRTKFFCVFFFFSSYTFPGLCIRSAIQHPGFPSEKVQIGLLTTLKAGCEMAGNTLVSERLQLLC